MAICEVCGNHYSKPMRVSTGRDVQVFDSFECAMCALERTCYQCGRLIFDRGIAVPNGVMYCCVDCARQAA
jgi:hypothetical protein